MASLYKRRDSPYWWLKRKDGARVVCESTGLRWRIPAETRSAWERRAAAEVEERRAGSFRGDWSWVDGWLSLRYGTRPASLRLRFRQWRPLIAYMKDIGVHSPAALTREHCLGYFAWRIPKRGQLRGASTRTALNDLGLLRLLMSEAVTRGLVGANPVERLGVPRPAPREKPALTAVQVQQVRDELVNGHRPNSGPWPVWMRHCWEVAVAQGCRIRETGVPLDCVDETRGTITFPATKGDRPFTTALNPDLLPLVRERRAAGASRLCDLPPNPSYWFGDLFRKLGMSGVSFHCTRVTVVSRLARAGVSQSQAMRFVGHASATVHRLYQRLGVEDLGACLTALRGSPPPEK